MASDLLEYRARDVIKAHNGSRCAMSAAMLRRQVARIIVRPAEH